MGNWWPLHSIYAAAADDAPTVVDDEDATSEGCTHVHYSSAELLL